MRPFWPQLPLNPILASSLKWPQYLKEFDMVHNIAQVWYFMWPTSWLQIQDIASYTNFQSFVFGGHLWPWRPLNLKSILFGKYLGI